MKRLTSWLLIRPGEGLIVLYLAGLHLVIGLGMAMGRGSSDALFFKRFGVEYLPHMLFLTSLLLVFVSTAYAAIVDRLRPARLFSLMFLFFCLYLVLVWLAMRLGHGVTAFAMYYIGYGVISEILVVHFNFYALGHFDSLQAQRLFPVVSAAARLGAVVGGVALGLSASLLQPEDVALVWVATLILALVLVVRRHRDEPPASAKSGAHRKHPWDDVREGLRFARRSSLLRIAALGMFIMILIISIQDYLASTLLTRHFSDTRSLAAFFGWFFAVTNGLVLMLQLLATNRLLRRFGLQVVNLIFPVSCVISLGLLTVFGGFWSALISRFNYMGMLPAFRIPAANLSFNALPAYMQGRAHALMTGLVLPAGFACSGLLLMMVPQEAVDARLAAFGLLLAVFYVWLKARKNDHYGDALLQVLQQQVFSGKAGQLEGHGMLTDRVIEGIKKLAQDNRDDAAMLAIADLLAEQSPALAGPYLLEIAAGTSPAMQDRLLQRIGRLKPVGWEAYAHRCLAHDDHHLRATALRVLVEAREPGMDAIIREWLSSGSLRLESTATLLAFSSGNGDLAGTGRTRLREMLASSEPTRQLAAVEVIEQLEDEEYLPGLVALSDARDERVRRAVARALGRLARAGVHDIDEVLAKLVRDASPQVRAMVPAALPAANDPDHRLSLLAGLLDDPDREVRMAAGLPAPASMPNDETACRRALNDHFNHFAMGSLVCRSLAEGELPNWRALLTDTALRHVEAARQKHALRLAIGLHRDKAPAAADQAVLSVILDEEVHRHVAQILEIMTLLDESEASRAVQAALVSRDRHLRAQALESVRHLDHAIIFQRLLPLLEGETDPAMVQAIQAWTTHPWHEILAWCAREGSRWLAQCATALKPGIPERT